MRKINVKTIKKKLFTSLSQFNPQARTADLKDREHFVVDPSNRTKDSFYQAISLENESEVFQAKKTWN